MFAVEKKIVRAKKASQEAATTATTVATEVRACDHTRARMEAVDAQLASGGRSRGVRGVGQTPRSRERERLSNGLLPARSNDRERGRDLGPRLSLCDTPC